MRRRIGIRFSDNDFSSSIRGFLNIMKERGIENYDLSKSKLVVLFNRSIEGVYWLCQASPRSSSYDKSWLRIEEKNVFLDEEVTKYVTENTSDHNYEFHVLDTMGHEPYIYSV